MSHNFISLEAWTRMQEPSLGEEFLRRRLATYAELGQVCVNIEAVGLRWYTLWCEDEEIGQTAIQIVRSTDVRPHTGPLGIRPSDATRMLAGETVAVEWFWRALETREPRNAIACDPSGDPVLVPLTFKASDLLINIEGVASLFEEAVLGTYSPQLAKEMEAAMARSSQKGRADELTVIFMAQGMAASAAAATARRTAGTSTLDTAQRIATAAAIVVAEQERKHAKQRNVNAEFYYTIGKKADDDQPNFPKLADEVCKVANRAIDSDRAAHLASGTVSEVLRAGWAILKRLQQGER